MMANKEESKSAESVVMEIRDGFQEGGGGHRVNSPEISREVQTVPWID